MSCTQGPPADGMQEEDASSRLLELLAPEPVDDAGLTAYRRARTLASRLVTWAGSPFTGALHRWQQLAARLWCAWSTYNMATLYPYGELPGPICDRLLSRFGWPIWRVALEQQPSLS